MIILKSIGNIGNEKQSLPTLLGCIENDRIPTEVKLAAIEALRRKPCSQTRNSKLIEMYRNHKVLPAISCILFQHDHLERSIFHRKGLVVAKLSSSIPRTTTQMFMSWPSASRHYRRLLNMLTISSEVVRISFSASYDRQVFCSFPQVPIADIASIDCQQGEQSVSQSGFYFLSQPRRCLDCTHGTESSVIVVTKSYSKLLPRHHRFLPTYIHPLIVHVSYP